MRPAQPALQRIVDERRELGPRSRGSRRNRATTSGYFVAQLASNTVDRAQRQQPDHRAHLEPLRAAVGQAQHVVEEAVLLVPHPDVVAAVHHRGGDPQEVLDELQRHVDVYVGSLERELDRDLEHVLAEQRHPRGAVGLLEVAAGRQRRAAVEHADVVQPEEAALEHVVAGAVLAVDPPREVEQQLVERPLEAVEVAAARAAPARGGR